MSTAKTRARLSPQILEEASAWFVEISEGDIGASGREQFNIWLRRSPEHIQAYLQIAALWEDTPLLETGRALGPDELIAHVLAEGNVVQLGPPDRAAPPPVEVPPQPLQEQTASRHVEQDVATVRGRWSQSRVRLFATAATLLLAIGAGVGYGLYRSPTYVTDIGEQRSVHLSDGSMVEINARSKLRVRFSDRERLVELVQGQAIFRVAKDPQRPFVVDSDGTRVRAVGTRFDVYRRSSGTVVTVLEGRVAVGSRLIESRRPHAVRPGDAEPAASSGKNAGGAAAAEASSARTREHEVPVQLALAPNEVLLDAGHQLTVGPIAWTAPELANIEAATAWTRREIVFQRSPLSEVIEEFNRYNPRKMVIADPSLRDTRISGVFSSTDPDSLLRFLSDLPNFSVQEAEDEVRISSR